MTLSSGGSRADLELARKVVSEAERAALDKAEEYLAQAEALLEAVGGQTGDGGSRARKQLEAEVQALRKERDEAVYRATLAESRLERLRFEQEDPLAQMNGEGGAPRRGRSLESAVAKEAEAERERILAEANKEAQELVSSVRRRLAGEIAGVRQAMSRAREGL